MARLMWSDLTKAIDPARCDVRAEAEKRPCRACRPNGRLPDGRICPRCGGSGYWYAITGVRIVPKREKHD